MDSLLMKPGVFVAMGIIMGLAAGWLFHRVWRALLPRYRSREFWISLPMSIRGMLSSEETPELFRHYRALISATGRHATRNTVAVLAGIAPASILFLIFHELDPSDRLTSMVEVRHAGDRRQLLDSRAVKNFPLEVAGATLQREDVTQKHALCVSTVNCLWFDIMLFKTHRLHVEHRAPTQAIVVRPAALNRNPFWPHFNDVEFCYFAALMAGGVVAALRDRRRMRP